MAPVTSPSWWQFLLAFKCQEYFCIGALNVSLPRRGQEKGLSWASERDSAFGWLQSETGCSDCIVSLLVWVQTDEEMLERVLQNSGCPGNVLRHDHQQLACSSLVFMIGLAELSLMTPVSEGTSLKNGLMEYQRRTLLPLIFPFSFFFTFCLQYS